MRLGFWNRLAIVATGLALLIAPLWIIVGINGDLDQLDTALYNACEKDAQALPLGKYYAAHDKCWKERFRGDRYRPGWSQWSEYAIGTFTACAILYALIFAVNWIVRWVWRGRAPAK